MQFREWSLYKFMSVKSNKYGRFMIFALMVGTPAYEIELNQGRRIYAFNFPPTFVLNIGWAWLRNVSTSDATTFI